MTAYTTRLRWKRRVSLRRAVELVVVFSVFGTSVLHAQSRRSDSSLAVLEDSVRLDSLDAELHLRLAGWYWRLLRYDDAERELRFTVSIDSRSAPALLALSSLPYARRPKLNREEARGRIPGELRSKVDEAHAIGRRAFLIDPLVEFHPAGPSDSRAIFRDPDERHRYVLFDGRNRPAADFLGLGIGAFFAQRYDLAYGALKEYEDRVDPGQRRDTVANGFYWFRGLAAAHIRYNGEAVRDFQTLLRRGVAQERADTLLPVLLQNNDIRYVLAVLHERAGLIPEAIAFYKEAIAGDLSLYMGHVRLAAIYRGLRRWPEAVDEARSAVAANPDDPTSVLELGLIYLDANRLAEAEEALVRAQTLNTRDPRIPYRLGMLEQLVGNAAEARAALTRFLAIAPTRSFWEIADAKAALFRLP